MTGYAPRWPRHHPGWTQWSCQMRSHDGHKDSFAWDCVIGDQVRLVHYHPINCNVPDKGHNPVPETSSDIVQSAHQDACLRAHGVDQIDTPAC